jgi:hypothetical protein
MQITRQDGLQLGAADLVIGRTRRERAMFVRCTNANCGLGPMKNEEETLGTCQRQGMSGVYYGYGGSPRVYSLVGHQGLRIWK